MLQVPKLYSELVDDWPRDREVCARRAAKLRKRGEDVRFDHFTVNGHSRYRWVAAVPRWPHAPRWSSARAAMLAFGRECERHRAPFTAFAATLQQQIVGAMGLPSELLSSGPRLGDPAPQGWIG